ncbi:MAG: PD-(D/E)XK nuclease family transposase [Bacteroidota bacterium]
MVKNQLGELVIIEVQNSKEYDRPAARYFHRMLFGTSKVITQYIKQGDPYANIKKVISVTIAYFDLGQGKTTSITGPIALWASIFMMS